MEDSLKIALPQSEILTIDKSRGNMIPEGRQCPLCQSPIRLFFVNFHEKLLMCENEECEFPFGHEDLQIYTVDSCTQSEAEDESGSVYTKDSPTATGSVISTSAWSEIDKLVRCCEEDTVLTTPMNSTVTNEKIIRDNKIQKNLEAISELNNQLHIESEKEDKNVTIRREKWLRSLKTIQEVSGVKLLKPEEMRLLKKEEPVIGLGELRIDIGQGNDNDVSSIKIEIHNKPTSSKEKGDPPV